MPLNNPAPQFGLLTSFDMTGQSGVTVFSRSGGSSVALPTYASGEGLYEDVLFFLNGRGSTTAFKAATQLSIGFGSSWSMTIDENDKIKITSDVDFELTKTGTDDPLGFGSSTVGASLVGSDYVLIASNDWTRGLIDLDNVTYKIDEVGGGGGTFNFPSVKSDVQDVTTFIRDNSQSDEDDFSLSSLQALDNSAQGSSDITWSITNSGFTQCHYRTTVGDITWSSTAIRDLLGFTGQEAAVVDGSHSRLTSTHKNQSVLIPSRPYQSHHLRVENVGQNRRKIGGGYVSNFIGSYATSVLRFDLDALLDQVDDYRHFTNKFLPLVGPGERVNFYQGWGDSRRALITSDIVGSQAAYDLLFTSEDNGSQGRVRGSLTVADFDLSYPTRLRRRVPVTLEIEHL